MNDEINRKHWARRFEFWLIVAACIVAAVLLGLGGCVDPSPGARAGAPEPSPVVRSFGIAEHLRVIEFRDSAGRICVLVSTGAGSHSWGTVDCGTPLPPLDYEQLPEPAVTRIPQHEPGKRPL